MNNEQVLIQIPTDFENEDRQTERWLHSQKLKPMMTQLEVERGIRGINKVRIQSVKEKNKKL